MATLDIKEDAICPVCGHGLGEHKLMESPTEIPVTKAERQLYTSMKQKIVGDMLHVTYWGIYCEEENCTHRTDELPFCFMQIQPELVNYSPSPEELEELEKEEQETTKILLEGYSCEACRGSGWIGAKQCIECMGKGKIITKGWTKK